MVFAHLGHILIDGPLFLGPVVLLGGALWVSSRRERKRKEQQQQGSR
jgi:hypothetical protein